MHRLEEIEPFQGRFLVRYPLLGWVLLLLLAQAAGATICIKPRVITVKEVEGLVVQDKDSAPLPGVIVYLLKETHSGWVDVAETMADGEGKFHIPGVRPGLYTLRWELAGFASGEGRLRVRRFALRSRATLVVVFESDLINGCGGWLELRRDATVSGDDEALDLGEFVK